MEEAKAAILAIVDPPKAELGKVYNGRVVNITKFGAFVNILPGRDGLVHISKLGRGKRINAVEDVLTLGQEIEVRVDEIDDKGKVSLSPAGDVPEPRRRRRRRPPSAPPSARRRRRRRRRRQTVVVRGGVRRRARRRARRPRPGQRAPGAERRQRRSDAVAATTAAVAAATVAAGVIADAASMSERITQLASRPDGRHRTRPCGAVGGDRRLGRRRRRVTSRPSCPASATSSSTCCSRARRRARRPTSPASSTASAATSTPSRRRSTRRTTAGCRRATAAFGIELLGDVLTHGRCRRRRRRERAPGDPRGAGDGRRLARRRRPAHARPRSCSATTASAATRPASATRSRRSRPTDVRDVLRRSTTAPAPRWSPSPATSTTTTSSPRSTAAFADDAGRRRSRRPRARRARRRPTSTSTTTPSRCTSPSAAARCRRDDPDREALDVVNHVFGGGLSSRLFDEIRERRGLAYSVYSATSAYADAGAWSVYAGAMPEHAGEVARLIVAELDRLVDRRHHRRRAGDRRRLPHRRLRDGPRGHRRPHVAGSAGCWPRSAGCIPVEEQLARWEARHPRRRAPRDRPGLRRRRPVVVASARVRR